MPWRRKKSEPPDDLTLDEAFVRAAPVVEPSAEQRVAQQRREWLDQQVHEGSRTTVQAFRRARRRRRWRRVPALLLSFLALAGLVWLAVQPQQPAEDVSDPVIGLGHGADRFTFEATVTDRPPPGVDQQAAPLGTPAPLTQTSDRYAFMTLQEDTTRPVAYDPCRPIHVVVNERSAPPGADRLLADALAAVQTATGLVLTVDGTTTEVPVQNRAPYQPDRYPDRWAPVLVAWSDPVESPRLAGDVSGTGGSAWFSAGGDRVYVTGSVVLDGPQLADVLDRRDGRAAAGAIIQHELGHLVGLDHVQDPEQLMYPTTSRRGFGAGDLTGLALLGRGRCAPEV